MHDTDKKFLTIEEAMAATVWCEYYRCRLLPNICDARRNRDSRRKWIDGDMAIIYDVCEKCTNNHENNTKIAKTENL